MKKYLITCSLVLVSLLFISWGEAGHRAVGQIAQNHLGAKAQAAVKALLGRQSLADVSTYADEIKTDADMKFMSPWHYINLPGDLTFEEFATNVLANKEGNVYSAILNCEVTLESHTKSRSDKVLALKMLVHLVGDCHQPMHVAHKDDQGGNKTAIKFLGQGENLHGLWDYGLIDHEGLNYKQMAEKYDTATPEQIKQWQNDAAIKWLYESYLITNELYKEAAENPDFKEEYYQSHIGLVHNRIMKAGIRLAGVLNRIYDVGE